MKRNILVTNDKKATDIRETAKLFPTEPLKIIAGTILGKFKTTDFQSLQSRAWDNAVQEASRKRKTEESKTMAESCDLSLQASGKSHKMCNYANFLPKIEPKFGESHIRSCHWSLDAFGVIMVLIINF